MIVDVIIHGILCNWRVSPYNTSLYLAKTVSEIDEGIDDSDHFLQG